MYPRLSLGVDPQCIHDCHWELIHNVSTTGHSLGVDPQCIHDCHWEVIHTCNWQLWVVHLEGKHDRTEFALNSCAWVRWTRLTSVNGVAQRSDPGHQAMCEPHGQGQARDRPGPAGQMPLSSIHGLHSKPWSSCLKLDPAFCQTDCVNNNLTVRLRYF